MRYVLYFGFALFFLGSACGDGQKEGPSAQLPDSPSGLTIHAGDGYVLLSWDAASSVTTYQIRRSETSGGPYGGLGKSNTGSYKDTKVINGKSYYYVVLGVNNNGSSALSLEVSATPELAENGEVPAAPTNLLGIALSETEISLAWADNSNDEDGFKIERKGAGDFSVVATVGAGITSFKDTGLGEATSYVYKVTAFNAVGDSATSNEVEVSTLNPSVPPPAAPSDLVATGSITKIHLTWVDHSNDEDGFILERKASNGGYFKVLANLAADTTQYDDATAAAGTVYVYRVSADNAGGSSDYSNEASASLVGGSGDPVVPPPVVTPPPPPGDTPPPIITPPPPPAGPSFASTVHPILMGSCAGCHNAGSFTALKLTGSAATDFPTVKALAGEGTSSKILQKPTGTPFHGGGVVFGVGSGSYNTILSWIEGGKLP